MLEVMVRVRLVPEVYAVEKILHLRLVEAELREESEICHDAVAILDQRLVFYAQDVHVPAEQTLQLRVINGVQVRGHLGVGRGACPRGEWAAAPKDTSE